MNRKLILIRGLPGSGKSTVAKKFTNTRHIEADMYFGKHYAFDPKKVVDAHNWCINETYDLLSDRVDVVVSNTFTTLEELRPYFEMAAIFGIVPTVILCQNSFQNVHGVPEEAVKKYKDKLQYDISPLYKDYFG
jgi:predicted kinase